MILLFGGLDFLSNIKMDSLVLPNPQFPEFPIVAVSNNEIKSYSELMNSKLSKQERDEIDRLTPIVNNSNCLELKKLYNDNPGWIIRPYINYLINEKSCNDKVTDEYIISKYPMLSDLDKALISGEIDIHQVSDKMHGMIKQQKLGPYKTP